VLKGTRRGRERQTHLVSSTTQFNQREPRLVKLLAHPLRLLRRHTTLGEVGRVDFDAQEEVGGNLLLDFVDDLEDDARTVLDGASVVVLPFVRASGEELSGVSGTEEEEARSLVAVKNELDESGDVPGSEGNRERREAEHRLLQPRRRPSHRIPRP
jgi:hypothetical protein